jgi:hypothetical protein
MGTTAPVRSSESSARHADPEEEPPHCLSSHRTLSRNAPPSAAASRPGKSRSGYTRTADPPPGAAADDEAAGCLAGAGAEEEDEEVEDEDGRHGLASSSFFAAAADD